MTSNTTKVPAAQLFDLMGEIAFNLTAGTVAAQITIEPAPDGSFAVTVETEPVPQPLTTPEPEFDFLTGITACTRGNPECESCQ